MMANVAWMVILAKLWDWFKVKNPKVATIIFAIGTLILIGVQLAGDLGFSLPKWVSIIVTLLTAIGIGFNNPSTYKILNPDTNSDDAIKTN